MYCRSCGKMLADNSTICINCGVPVGRGKRFCPVCGEATADGAVFCVKCGAGFAPPQPAVPKDAKSRLLAGLFGIFLGCWGVHDFYLGNVGKAIVHLMMSSFCLISYILLMLGLIVDPYGSDFLIVCAVIFFIGLICIIASWIWAFVESIMLLCGSKKTDGMGRPLKD